MATCSTFTFGNQPVTCHAYNKDQTELALSLNNEKVTMYKLVNKKWEKYDELVEHQGKVTGLDWAPNTNQIVSCGADRNAFVWHQDEFGKWKPTMVLLRINRAAICVRWSPQENKFAVGTGSRVINICHYDSDNNWWISKNIKKPIRSSVLSVAWHPNNYLIAAGSSDNKCRVFSAYVKAVEGRPAGNEWGKRLPFGELLAEYGSPSGGWIHGVGFNNDGTQLAWVSHNSCIGFAIGGEPEAKIARTRFRPFTSCYWTSPSSLVAVGFDCNPIAFNLGPNGFEFADKCDQEDGGGSAKQSKFGAMFRDMDSKGTTQAVSELKTRHKNSILEIIPCKSGFSTCGADGQVIQWSLNNLASKLQNLKL